MRNVLPGADLLKHTNQDATYCKIRAGAPEPQTYPKWMLGHRHRRSRPVAASKFPIKDLHVIQNHQKLPFKRGVL